MLYSSVVHKRQRNVRNRAFIITFHKRGGGNCSYSPSDLPLFETIDYYPPLDLNRIGVPADFPMKKRCKVGKLEE